MNKMVEITATKLTKSHAVPVQHFGAEGKILATVFRWNDGSFSLRFEHKGSKGSYEEVTLKDTSVLPLHLLQNS